MKNKEILVLGHKGMLGQMVKAYFSEKGYKIITPEFRFNSEEREAFLDEIKKYPGAIVMNCIGKIKQKTDNDNELLWANALLPLALNETLPESQLLIHPSTDCVFDGLTEQAYSQEANANAKDSYGWSKRLGEVALSNRKNTVIYRVSIIGPDSNPNGKGLLNWFLSNNSGADLNGFENHYWNGITTLEWCKKIEKIINNFNVSTYVFEIGGTGKSYSKYEMLTLFQEYFHTEYNINSIKTERVDRRMIPTFKSPDLEDQLKDLKGFMSVFQKYNR